MPHPAFANSRLHSRQEEKYEAASCIMTLGLRVRVQGLGFIYLDWSPDALEVLRHVQGQNDILLQHSFGFCQTSNVVPGDARACIQHVPVRIIMQGS